MVQFPATGISFAPITCSRDMTLADPELCPDGRERPPEGLAATVLKLQGGGSTRAPGGAAAARTEDALQSPEGSAVPLGGTAEEAPDVMAPANGESPFAPAVTAMVPLAAGRHVKGSALWMEPDVPPPRRLILTLGRGSEIVPPKAEPASGWGLKGCRADSNDLGAAVEVSAGGRNMCFPVPALSKKLEDVDAVWTTLRGGGEEGDNTKAEGDCTSPLLLLLLG